jgi:hypothetical protein
MVNDSQAPKRRTKPFSRLQWSVNGVTIYNGSGSFITRIEDGRDIGFLERLLVSGLRKISAEQQERRAFVAKGDAPSEIKEQVVEEEAPDEEPLTPI